jgi:transposase
LMRYIEDGRLSIDNNLSERLLRGIAVARSFCPYRA